MRTAWLLSILAIAGCGKVASLIDGGTTDGANVDSTSAIDAAGAADACATCVTSYSLDNTWNCASGVDCQDVYDFETTGANTMMVTVKTVTGTSCPRLGVFAGGTASGTNLFNALVEDVCQLAQDTDLTAGPVALPTAGHYQLTVGRDWGFSANGGSGTYTVDVAFTDPVVARGQTADDVASANPPCVGSGSGSGTGSGSGSAQSGNGF